ARSADRQPVRVVLADVEPRRVARRLARRTSLARDARRRAGGVEVGSARQARSGEHQRACPVPGAGRPQSLAHPVLLEQAGFAGSVGVEDTEGNRGHRGKRKLADESKPGTARRAKPRREVRNARRALVEAPWVVAAAGRSEGRTLRDERLVATSAWSVAAAVRSEGCAARHASGVVAAAPRPVAAEERLEAGTVSQDRRVFVGAA